ncbi:MAG: hypothetical protein WAS05_00710 [Candidatus Nanopelagicales bacterium]
MPVGTVAAGTIRAISIEPLAALGANQMSHIADVELVGGVELTVDGRWTVKEIEEPTP